MTVLNTVVYIEGQVGKCLQTENTWGAFVVLLSLQGLLGILASYLGPTMYDSLRLDQ